MGVYACTCMCVCVCVCASMCLRERKKEGERLCVYRKREEMTRTHKHTRCNRRVSCPPLSIQPAWHNPTSLCPEGQHIASPDDVDFTVNEHQFVDPVAVSMHSKETVPKVCIVFPMLRQTVGKVTNVLVKALVVVRV